MASKSREGLQSLTREQFWEHHIKHWRSSGLSKMRYCRDNALPYHQLNYWCSKSLQPANERAEKANFVGVSVLPADSQSGGTLTVDLPNGISVSGVDAQTMALLPALLRLL